MKCPIKQIKNKRKKNRTGKKIGRTKESIQRITGKVDDEKHSGNKIIFIQRWRKLQGSGPER
jgi:hypothetical protein